MQVLVQQACKALSATVMSLRLLLCLQPAYCTSHAGRVCQPQGRGRCCSEWSKQRCGAGEALLRYFGQGTLHIASELVLWSDTRPSYLQTLLQLVIQLTKARGIHTVNVVRDRPNMGELEHSLKGLGADIVTTDDKLKSALGN